MFEFFAPQPKNKAEITDVVADLELDDMLETLELMSKKPSTVSVDDGMRVVAAALRMLLQRTLVVAALLLPIAAHAQPYTPQAIQSVPISVSTATTTNLIAGQTGQSIYVYSWDIVTTLANNVTLEYGTGATCGTGTTVLTGAYPLAANGVLTVGSFGTVFTIPRGNSLCIITSASTQASGHVSYIQQ